MAGKLRPQWIAEVLITSTGCPGTTGMIVDVDRRYAPNPATLLQLLVAKLNDEIERCWPASATLYEIDKTPQALHFRIDIERKEVKTYGK